MTLILSTEDECDEMIERTIFFKVKIVHIMKSFYIFENNYNGFSIYYDE